MKMASWSTVHFLNLSLWYYSLKNFLKLQYQFSLVLSEGFVLIGCVVLVLDRLPMRRKWYTNIYFKDYVKKMIFHQVNTNLNEAESKSLLCLQKGKVKKSNSKRLNSERGRNTYIIVKLHVLYIVSTGEKNKSGSGAIHFKSLKSESFKGLSTSV